jgi:hypothetical protein
MCFLLFGNLVPQIKGRIHEDVRVQGGEQNIFGFG